MSTKRVALYARYSTDMQNENSIADQFTSCQQLLKDDEHIVAEFSDRGISGSNIHNRPGIKDLLKLIEGDDEIDTILTESIDRLSRSQAQIAQIFALAEYHSVAIRTVLEGEVDDLHIGVKGAMNAIELKKISERTRRGQRGAVSEGKFPGGLAYGHKMGTGKGIREINETEASIVREIYGRYLAGESIKGIATDLNKRGVSTNRGNRWNVSTIRGHQGRGTGILQNPIYKGVMIWNRFKWIKHPVTGRRNRRPNDPSVWVRQEFPELQIIDDETWERVQAKLAGSYSPHRIHKRSSPLPFIPTCGGCGGSIVRHDAKYLICRNHHNHGTCNQRHKINIEELYNQVMLAVRADPDSYLLAWKRNMISVTPNTLARKALLESEVDSLNDQVAELQERLDVKRRELAELEPAISDTPDHRRRFVEICKSAVEPEQIVSFIAGVTVVRRGGGRLVVANLKPNWKSIIKLASPNRSGHKTSA